ncbi:hypothetical protein DMENIID0001_130670 [Sergentomyia squamirostris]
MGSRHKNPSQNKGRKRKKLIIEFDEKKRREFLTGFRKRKLQRKEKAKEEIEQKLKQERQQLKEEIRSNITKQFKKSFQPIPELEEQENQLDEEEYETEDVTVKITELSTYDLAKENNWVGQNRPKCEESTEVKEESEEESEEEEIPGMSVSTKSTQQKKQKEVEIKDSMEIKSKKELNRMVQNHTMKFLQKSKAFKMKTQLQRSKNKQKSRREKNKKVKLLKKKSRRGDGKAKKKLEKIQNK